MINPVLSLDEQKRRLGTLSYRLKLITYNTTDWVGANVVPNRLFVRQGATPDITGFIKNWPNELKTCRTYIPRCRHIYKF